MKYLLVSLTFFGISICSSVTAQKNVDPITHPKKSISKKSQSITSSTATSKNHQTLLAFLRATDMEDLLDHAGPFTIFAPSDRAFEKLSGKSVETLLNPENKEELKSLLTYHMVAGNLSASKILKAMCRGNGKALFTTVQGDTVMASMKGIDIILTDTQGNTATIVVADSNQLNGIIHEIDSVILPNKI